MSASVRGSRYGAGPALLAALARRPVVDKVVDACTRLIRKQL